MLKVKTMIKPNDIKEFKNKLYETEERYFNLIKEKEEQSELTFMDKNTISIWEDRIGAIEHMMNELNNLEFELFV